MGDLPWTHHPRGQTDARETITLPHTTYAVGKNGAILDLNKMCTPLTYYLQADYLAGRFIASWEIVSIDRTESTMLIIHNNPILGAIYTCGKANAKTNF